MGHIYGIIYIYKCDIYIYIYMYLYILCLLLFYIIATSKFVSGWVRNCDSVHSW